MKSRVRRCCSEMRSSRWASTFSSLAIATRMISFLRRRPRRRSRSRSPVKRAVDAVDQPLAVARVDEQAVDACSGSRSRWCRATAHVGGRRSSPARIFSTTTYSAGAALGVLRVAGACRPQARGLRARREVPWLGVPVDRPSGWSMRRPVTMPSAQQLEDAAVRRLEHLRLLHADGRQLVDVEEAAVVDLVGRHPPEGQPVGLGVEQRLEPVEAARVARPAVERRARLASIAWRRPRR